MIVANKHNSEPITDKEYSDHSAILAEVNAFNREALEIIVEAEVLLPQSKAFEVAGEKLAALVKAGLQNLEPDEFAEFQAGFAKMQAFKRGFEPKFNALLERQARHQSHRKRLVSRLKAAGLLVDLVPGTAFGSN